MKIIYIKETEETCDFVKRIILKIKKILNIIKVESKYNNFVFYYLPLFKNSRFSKYRIKKLSNKINKLLEQDVSNTIVLSENLNKNRLLKNYLYIENINILDGRYLFKCLIYNMLEYIFRIKNKAMEFRGDILANK